MVGPSPGYLTLQGIVILHAENVSSAEMAAAISTLGDRLLTSILLWRLWHEQDPFAAVLGNAQSGHVVCSLQQVCSKSCGGLNQSICYVVT